MTFIETLRGQTIRGEYLGAEWKMQIAQGGDGMWAVACHAPAVGLEMGITSPDTVAAEILATQAVATFAKLADHYAVENQDGELRVPTKGS